MRLALVKRTARSLGSSIGSGVTGASMRTRH
jgi:hypothetical protein